MNRTQLAMNLQMECLTKLPSWRKHRKNALYRRTEDFVQWLLFDTSSFRVAVVPHFALQALAVQFPTKALTLGDRVRNTQGSGLWITPDDYKTKREEIAERIVQQVNPPALEPLTNQAILMFLERLQSTHASAVTARAVTKIVEGDFDDGYRYLNQALDKFRRISAPWARIEEARLNGWLSCASEDIIYVLRQQAQVGIQLLRLK